MATTKTSKSTRSTKSTKTTAGKTTTGKTAKAPTPRKTIKVTPKPAASTPEPVVVEESKPATVSAAMRKKGLVDAVTERSGVKRKFVKPAIEAALAEIGEAIAAGRDLNLPGLGKIKVQRSKKMSNGDVYITRIRRPLANTDAPAGDDPKDPLAEAAE